MKETSLLNILFKLIAIVIIIFSLICIFVIANEFDDNTNDISRFGKEFKSSIFTQYQNKIYAIVPSNGYYHIPQADLTSFHLIDTKQINQQAAADKNHVYCGNLMIEKLNPQNTKHIGHNYYSDGVHTFYCAPRSTRNTDINKLQEVVQFFLYHAKLGNKPQTYWYPYFELEPSEQPYTPILNVDIVTNGKNTYFEGQKLENTNPNTLRQIPSMTNSGQRKSYDFFADGQHVYYRHHLLTLIDNPQIYSIEIGNSYFERYLLDPKNGMVYVKNIAFDPKHAPYQLLTIHDNHVNQILFSSRDGVYFYNTEKNEQQRAGDNPFLNSDFVEIAPYIFYDQQKTLYLQASEVWGTRKSPGLKSRSTYILELKDIDHNNHWEKIATLHYHYGEVWRKGRNYYYFDQLGDSQLIKKTVYLIKDLSVIDILLQPKIRVDEIRDLISEKKLVEVEHSKILKVKTSYQSDWFFYLLVIIIFISLLLKITNRKNTHKKT